MISQQVAQAFPPGEFIREELAERGWSQVDLAHILDVTPPVVNQILAGKRKISTEIATRLGSAFGTDAQLWLNLQTSFDLWSATEKDEAVARRARLHTVAPVREMIKRGWIEHSREEGVDALEERVCAFFSIDNIDQEPVVSYAAKTSLVRYTTAQRAWLFRSKQIAKTVSVGTAYSAARLTEAVGNLRRLLGAPEEARHVPQVLASAGIRFVVVEPLPSTRIDGACLWLDKDSPVIVTSLRFDRIDSFWHAVFHECGHIKHRHASLDIDLVGQTPDEEAEILANTFADSAMLPGNALADFINRVGPLYSHEKILGFAKVHGIHPGIVVGQLQYRREIGFQHSRKFLAPIRSFVVASALTDGWGSMLPSNI